MQKKTYFSTTGIIFFIITLVHLLRIILKLEITFGEAIIPMWWSWIGIIIAGPLAYHGLMFNHKTK
ncbi:MAG: hypothetical protein Q7R86_02835 [bacterium]|nr:hypothetical protein [bacterium]